MFACAYMHPFIRLRILIISSGKNESPLFICFETSRQHSIRTKHQHESAPICAPKRSAACYVGNFKRCSLHRAARTDSSTDGTERFVRHHQGRRNGIEAATAMWGNRQQVQQAPATPSTAPSPHHYSCCSPRPPPPPPPYTLTHPPPLLPHRAK